MSEINGLLLTFTGQELIDIALKRAEYHASKGDFYEAEATRLVPVMEEMQDRAESMGKFSNSTGSNAVQQFRDKARQSRDSVTYFKTISTHLVASNTYLLSRSDLAELQVLQSAY